MRIFNAVVSTFLITVASLVLTAWWFEQPSGSGAVTEVSTAFLSVPSTEDYYTMSIDDLVMERPDSHRIHTHLCVEGKVGTIKKEKDGDIHITLLSDSDKIILEIVPQTLISVPPKQSKIIACGISRWDGWAGHEHWEVHPVWSWRYSK